jgi:hypothetical protein
MTVTAGPDVPASPENASPEWFTATLRAAGVLGPDGAVTEVAAQPVGNGLVGDSIRFTLGYRGDPGDAPTSVVAKFPAADPHYRAAALAEQVYQRERLFYRELAGALAIRVPRCLRAGTAEGDFVLLLEDLGPAVGGDQIAGCSVERAEAVVDAAAGLHAPGWGDPALEQAAWDIRPGLVERAGRGYPALFERFAAELGPRLDPADLEIGARLAPVIGEWFAGQPRPWTLTHGDFRLDNMLFDIRDGREPVGVLDWQTIMPGPGTVDVAYFLGGCLPTPLRRAHEPRLLRRYHDRLQALGVRDYPFERCERDYRYNTFLGYFMATYAPMVVRRTERGDQMFTVWLARTASQIRDLGSLELLPAPSEQPEKGPTAC